MHALKMPFCIFFYGLLVFFGGDCRTWQVYVTSSWPDQHSEQRIGIEGIAVPPKGGTRSTEQYEQINQVWGDWFLQKVKKECHCTVNYKNETWWLGEACCTEEGERLLEKCGGPVVA
jgi:hypothetical protein